jgi:hypothetical protein
MSEQILEPELGENFFVDLLSKEVYTLDGVFYEQVKNAEDSAKVKKQFDKDFRLKVKISLVSNHPLNPGGKSLMTLDNAGGVVDDNCMILVGPGKASKTELSIHGAKHVGRFGTMSFVPRQGIKSTDISFSIITRNAKGGPVIEYGVMWNGSCVKRIAADAIYKSYIKWIGDDTFTMVLCPHIIDELSNLKKLKEVIESLQMLLPRIEDENSTQFFFQEKKIEPVPLPTTLVIEEQGIVGYFELTKDPKWGGVKIYDAETNSFVANAFEMAGKITPPLNSPDITGAVFIPGTRNHQDPGRRGLAPQYVLYSTEWKRACYIFNEYFRPKLEKLLGNLGIINKKNPVSKMVMEFVDVLHHTHSVNPDAKLDLAEIPDINDPENWPNGEDDKEGTTHKLPSKRMPKKNKGSHSRGTGKKDNNPRVTLPPMTDRKDKTKRRDRAIFFPYKDKVFWISFPTNMPASAAGQYATLSEDNVVWFHAGNDVFQKHLVRSSVAARMHFVSSVIGAIEYGMNKHELGFTEKFMATVNTAVAQYYSDREKFLNSKKK